MNVKNQLWKYVFESYNNLLKDFKVYFYLRFFETLFCSDGNGLFPLWNDKMIMLKWVIRYKHDRRL